ncbi:thioredoxin-like protein [Podospora didyma]|uniref:Thioredoxin-like protein n=1 Tax=Podospora didyma TaxID=330526 RepID=A0AAE0K9H0_9PEZI|nr:thioredoxin-like protein [Podospora didyma]
MSSISIWTALSFIGAAHLVIEVADNCHSTTTITRQDSSLPHVAKTPTISIQAASSAISITSSTMSATVHIGSSAQWRQVLSSSSIVVTDFYADWCGPCKMIAPTFESLSTKYSKPKKITFCKVDVDKQGEVAQLYGVRAMPTFLIFHNGSVINTIQGANPPALSSAVERAVKLAGAGAAPGVVFGTPGQRLGGTGLAAPGRTTSVARTMAWDLNNLINTIIAFFGLYFVSLLSLDPYKAAENSPFNKKNPPPTAQAGPGAKKPAARPTFKTLADLGSDSKNA